MARYMSIYGTGKQLPTTSLLWEGLIRIQDLDLAKYFNITLCFKIFCSRNLVYKLYLSDVSCKNKTEPEGRLHVKIRIGTLKFMMPSTVTLMDELMRKEN